MIKAMTDDVSRCGIWSWAVRRVTEQWWDWRERMELGSGFGCSPDPQSTLVFGVVGHYRQRGQERLEPSPACSSTVAAIKDGLKSTHSMGGPSSSVDKTDSCRVATPSRRAFRPAGEWSSHTLLWLQASHSSRLVAMNVRNQEAHVKGSVIFLRRELPMRVWERGDMWALEWFSSCSRCTNNTLTAKNSLNSMKGPLCTLSMIFAWMWRRAGEMMRGPAFAAAGNGSGLESKADRDGTPYADDASPADGIGSV